MAAQMPTNPLNPLQAKRLAKQLGLDPNAYGSTARGEWTNQALADALGVNIIKSGSTGGRTLATPTAMQPAPTTQDVLANATKLGDTQYRMMQSPFSYLTDKGKEEFTSYTYPRTMEQLQAKAEPLGLTLDQLNAAYNVGQQNAYKADQDFIEWRRKNSGMEIPTWFKVASALAGAHMVGKGFMDAAASNLAPSAVGAGATAGGAAVPAFGTPFTAQQLGQIGAAAVGSYNNPQRGNVTSMVNTIFPSPLKGAPGIGDLEIFEKAKKSVGLNNAQPFAGGGKYDSEARATPEKRPMIGALARLVERADKFARAPFGYSNPPVEMLSDLLSVPQLYRTMENYAYGSPLTRGTGQARVMTEDTKAAIEGALNLAPAVGPALKATKATARAAAPYAARSAVELAEKYGVAPTMNVIKPKDEKQVLTRVLSEGAPLLRKGSLEKTLATLEASQKANLERQPLIESLYRYHANENPKIAESLERMYEGLEKPVDLDAAVKAYGEGFIVPGSRISFSKDIGVRSPQAQYPGLHFAAPGREQQLQHFIELYANEFAPDRPKAFSPTIRPVLAKAGKPIQLSDEAFEYPDILAKELGLTKEFRKAVDQFYSKPRDFSKIDRDAVEADIITKLLAKKNIDLGVYTNVAEGVLGPENTSFVSFGKNKLRGFAQGGIVEYDPDHIESLAQGFDAEEFASGGLVDYDPNEIDTIVSQLNEEFYG